MLSIIKLASIVQTRRLLHATCNSKNTFVSPLRRRQPSPVSTPYFVAQVHIHTNIANDFPTQQLIYRLLGFYHMPPDMIPNSWYP